MTALKILGGCAIAVGVVCLLVAFANLCMTTIIRVFG